MGVLMRFKTAGFTRESLIKPFAKSYLEETHRSNHTLKIDTHFPKCTMVDGSPHLGEYDAAEGGKRSGLICFVRVGSLPGYLTGFTWAKNDETTTF